MKSEIKNGIVITIVVLLIILITYLSTAIFATGEIGGSKKTTTTKDSSSEEVSSLYDDMIIASKTFSKKESEYMVIFFSEKESTESIKTSLKSYSGDLKLYKVNTDEAINKYVINDEENSAASSANELKIKGTTLIVINNKKITSYITDEDQILEKLK